MKFVCRLAHPSIFFLSFLCGMYDTESSIKFHSFDIYIYSSSKSCCLDIRCSDAEFYDTPATLGIIRKEVEEKEENPLHNLAGQSTPNLG